MSNSTIHTPPETTFSFLRGGGEMGELTRTYEWSQTALGNPDQWPQSLRTTLNILLNSRFPMFLFWGKDLYCFYNDAYRAILGNAGKHPYILGKPAAAAWPEAWPKLNPLIDRTLAGEEAISNEDQLVPIYRNGQLENVYWTFSYSAVHDESGLPAGVFVTCMETSKTVEHSHKLQLSEQRFQNLVREATVGIIVLSGEEMRVDIVNGAYGEIISRTPEELIGNPLFDIIPEAETHFRPILDEVRLTGKSIHLYDHPYFVYVQQEKKEGYLNLVFQPYTEVDGRRTGIVAMCHDVTEQVLARFKVEESEQNLRNIISQAPVAMSLFHGPRFIIGVTNSRSLELWGRTIEETLGKPIYEVLPEATGKDHEKILKQVYTTGKTYSAFGIPVSLHRNGRLETVYVSYTYEPYREPDGVISGVMAVATEVTEEVTARKKIEESEKYFRQLTETVPAIIWITRPDGYCTYLNKNWYDYTGQTKEEAEGFGWLSPVYPNDIEQTKKTFLKANENQDVFNALYRMRNKKGEYRWVIDTGRPKFKADGTYEGMIGSVVDVHEQKLAEEKMAQSEARFRSLIAAAPVAIGLFMGRDLVIETPNQTFIDIVGKGNDIIGKPLREVMPELLTESQPFLRILDDVYTSGVMYQTSGTLVKIVQQGVLKNNYYNFSYTPLLDAEGRIYAILDTATDVTEQVLARQKLEEAEERTRLAVESAELGTYEVNLLTNEIVPSPRFNEIFDVHHSTERNRYINSIYKDDLPVRDQAYKNAYETGILDYTVRLIRKTGATHWVRTKGKIYFDDAHQPVRMLGVSQDITEQVELERQKDTFLSIASHELKTPVTSIKGYAQLMEKMFRRSGDLKSAALVAKMNHQANRLNSLIADLLDVTKINNGKLQFNFTSFDFNQLVDEVVEDMQHTSPDYIIKKEFNFTGMVYGDRERISQVVINLLSNAIKYSPDKQQITIFTENHENEVQLCVQDFGIGISPDKQDRIFEQFYRVSGTREHTFPGLGLGLYISSEIVKRMEGRIWVNSTEGKGSTFCFAIPVQLK